MIAKRTRGRPCKGADSVGRSKIIELLQAALRTSQFDDLSRKTIAEHIDVTPALITYYFPKKQCIIEAATKPIVDAYLQEINLVVLSERSVDEKLQSVIYVLLRCFHKDAGIIKAFENIFRTGGGKRSFIDIISIELEALVGELFRDSPKNDYKAAAVQGAITGMCELVAQSAQTRGSRNSGSYVSDADKACFIYAFIINGLTQATCGNLLVKSSAVGRPALA